MEATTKTIPEEFRELLENPNPVIFSTTMPDGQPQSTVLWVKLEYDDTIKLSTTAERQKSENLRNNPRASLVVVDPDNMYRYLEVRGHVDVSHEGGVELINELAQKYRGKSTYYGDVAPKERQQNETRVVLTLKPEHIVARG
jgi:PPOX class probable F420-dependent enzyme